MTNQVMATGAMVMTLKEKMIQSQKIKNLNLFPMMMTPKVNSQI